jgi:hypothetical protein
VRFFSRVVASIAIVGGAVGAASCASFGASEEPTPAPAADAGPAPITEGGAIGDGGAPPDAPPVPTGPPGPTLPCPTNTLLCDAFEDRNGSNDVAGTRWKLLSGPGAGRIDDAMWLSGTHSLAIDVPTGTSANTLGLEAKPTITGTGVTLRAAIHLSALPPYAQLMSMVADPDGSFFAVIVDKGKLVAQHRDGANKSVWVPTTTDVPVGRWFNVAFELRFGPTGGVRLSVDGAPIYDKAAMTTNAATISYFALIVEPNLGSSGTAPTQPITIHYDDIVLE